MRNGRPIVYRGQGTGGHAFNFDGFEDDFFHVNWGWSGSSNGYFLVTSLSPGNNNFSEAQGCISGIYPNYMQMWDRPYNMVALAGDARVTLAWEAQYHRDLAYFKIYRNGEAIAQSEEKQFTDETAVNGETYEYAITALFSTDTADYESDLTSSITLSPAAGFSLPYNENFEDGCPGWTLSGDLRGFNWGNELTLGMGTDEENHFVGITSAAAGTNKVVSDYLISNGYNFSEASHVVVSFDYVLKKWQDVDHLYLVYRVFGDTEWTQILELDKTLNYQDWSHSKTYLPERALTDHVQLAFYYTDNGDVGYGAGIDNINIEEIADPGVPDFTTSVEESCIGSAIVFTDASRGTKDSYSWDFGRGATPRYAETEGPHSVTYGSNGPKSVSLVLNDLDVVVKDSIVHIVREPRAKFSHSINFKTVSFKNTSQYASVYMWDFGDGVKVTQPEPTHAYALSGDYLVELIAINHICPNDTVQKLVQIRITGIEDQALETDISMYPNPASDKLHVTMTDAPSGQILAEIISLTGQIVHKDIQNVQAGILDTEIDLSELNPGVYILKLSSKLFTKHLRFSKQ